MDTTFVRGCVTFLTLVISLSAAGCTGPPGPPGPAGPPGPSSGGPPYVWVCAPAYLTNAGSNARADLFVFNGSGATANVAVNILDASGNNLAGVQIPGAPAGTLYPGESGATTAAVASGVTRNVNWLMPTNMGPGPGVSTTVRVTSDQPVVVTSFFQWNPMSMPNQCSLLPK